MLQKELDNEFSKMILSASGFRKVFAQDGDAQSKTTETGHLNALICTAISKAFFSEKLEAGDTILMGCDSRPTGKEICRVMGSVFACLGVKVEYCGIIAVDELLAQSVYGNYKAFAYVSASHNPVGHNGLKFGTMGGVFGQKEIFPVIERIKNEVKDIAGLENLLKKAEGFSVDENPALKAESFKNYRDFILKTNSPQKAEHLGIVADFNGSARCTSIDRKLFEELGIKTKFINDSAGEIVHEILPEGKNLDYCRELLQKMHAQDPDFVLGYVPDNDGDRGNLVYIDEDGKAKVMAPQEVFALCVYSALEFASSNNVKNLAVAVNCATSMRIDEIAKMFNAKVFRAEVGEANAVNLADYLRQNGCNVPILGEGSNGGNITHPSRARDPLNTLMCMLRILKKTSIPGALKNLPVYTTSDASSKEAILHLDTDDYPALKRVYENNFASQWKEKEETLNQWNIVSYSEFQTEGIKERQESGNGNKGGLKMVFYDASQSPVAFIWMRPSGTEPLFRILADVKGDKKTCHDFLLQWQAEMIMEAQKEVLQG